MSVQLGVDDPADASEEVSVKARRSNTCTSAAPGSSSHDEKPTLKRTTLDIPRIETRATRSLSHLTAPYPLALSPRGVPHGVTTGDVANALGLAFGGLSCGHNDAVIQNLGRLLSLMPKDPDAPGLHLMFSQNVDKVVGTGDPSQDAFIARMADAIWSPIRTKREKERAISPGSGHHPPPSERTVNSVAGAMRRIVNMSTSASMKVISPLQQYLKSMQIFAHQRGEAKARGLNYEDPDCVPSPSHPFSSKKSVGESLYGPARQRTCTEVLFTLYQISTLRYSFLHSLFSDGSSLATTPMSSARTIASDFNLSPVPVIGRGFPYFLISVTSIQVGFMVGLVIAYGFVPTSENPLVGPNYLSFIKYGAAIPSLVSQQFNQESWRILAPTFLHAGFVHLLFNILNQITLGVPLERAWGSWRIAFIYVSSACIGVLLTVQVRTRDVIAVGASGSVLGLFGATLADHLINSDFIFKPRVQFIFFATQAVIIFAVGLLSVADNIVHVGGFWGGVFSGMTVIPVLSPLHTQNSRSLWRTRFAGALLLSGLFFALVISLFLNIRWSCAGHPWCCYILLTLSC